MPKVDFYLLENRENTSVFLTVCRLCEKAYDQQKTVYIQTASKQDAELLDKLLWTYNDITFLPHGIAPAKTPIIIAHFDSLPSENYDILVNLTQNTLAFFNQFQRVIEVVSGEETQRQAARLRYRFYRDNQCELQSHQLQK